jgi:hypothetical protein
MGGREEKHPQVAQVLRQQGLQEAELPAPSTMAKVLNRLVGFVDTIGKPIQLLYYPPYHSKNNPIERCWGILARTGELAIGLFSDWPNDGEAVTKC